MTPPRVEKPDLVVFGEDWGRHPTSTQHLVRCLAADRRVLWINSIGMRRPRLDRRDLARIATKATDLLARPATRSAGKTPGDAPQLPPNFSVLAPTAVPWPASSLAFRLNRTLLARQLNRALQARNMTRPILWTSLPTALPAVGTLGERALVYYCGDDFGSLVGVDHEPILDMERRLVEKADLVLAASDVLASRFPAEKTLLVPHGTDLNHFGVDCPRAADLPAGDKIAGFYGSIDARLDFDMLATAARSLPDWQFVMIGPVQTDLSAINAIPNIHVLGPRPYAALPRYVRHWDVSMILYRIEAQTLAGNPLKMREYLAAGTPIATTDVPSLAPYRDLLAIAEARSDFARAIQRAATDHARNGQRRAAVANDSWQARAAGIDARLEAFL